MTNLAQRSITAVLFASAVISLVLVGPWTFLVFCAIVLVAGHLEFFKLIRSENVEPQTIPGLILSVCLFAMVVLVTMGTMPAETLIIILPLVFAVFIIELYRNKPHPFLDIAVTLLGSVYLAIPLSMMAVMALHPVSGTTETYHGALVMGCILHVWASDTGAYFIGTRFGRTKLFERISPKKSWEGFFGGLALSFLASWINHSVFGELELHQWMVISVIVTVFGTLGDLTESMLKRSIHIKDSGTIFPGHGGILDRFDAVLIAMPFVCAYLWMIGRFG
ncbi:MAG: phosphatidate cytidylyltransferase [Bacteroidota bacterium]